MRPRRRQRAKMNIPMCLACVLLCLTLFSLHFTSRLYARYTVSSSGADSARVITFGQIELTETGDFETDGKTMKLIPGVDLKKTARVSFDGSEAATYVFVKVDLTSDNMTWTKSDDTYSLMNGSKMLMEWSVDTSEGWQFLKQETDNAYIYYMALAPNQSLSDADIIEGADTSATDGYLTVSEYITQSEMKQMTGISISFQAAAVQSGGFASAEAAWDSVKTK